MKLTIKAKLIAAFGFVLVLTTAALLLAVPSFTTKVATYTPTVSGTNVGLDVVDKSKTVELPVGLVDNTHLYVKVSPLASVLAVPSSVTVAVTVTVWAVPALATGAELLTLE